MASSRTAICLAVGILLTAACRSSRTAAVKTAPEYDALFSRRDGWTGADGAASVPLGGGRVLWLFDDTWIGSARGGAHVDSTMVPNTVAIQTGAEAASARVDFHRGSRGGKPAAFFTPTDGKGVFWPASGALTASGLYVIASRIVKKESDGSVFGFKTAGRTLVRVLNPQDPPDRWSTTQAELPWTRFGDALLESDGKIYAYGLEAEGKDRFLLLARVPEAKFAEFKKWEFYAAGGWQSDPAKAARLADHLGAELSVSYSERLRNYVAVYTWDGLSRDIVVRFAPAPEGPWSEARTVFRCPEMDWDKDYFCYAAKAHPELSPKGNELLISYVVNSFDSAKMARDARIYRPRFVKLTLSPAER